jgi:mutator protein MutT
LEKHLDVAVAIVFRDSKVLVTRRKRGRVLGGYWEFPGGKLETGETLHDCVRREIQEELGILVQPVISFTPVPYQYADKHVTLHAFLCTHESGEPQPLAAEKLRWVTSSELQALTFPPANQQLIEQVIAAIPAARTVGKTTPKLTLPKLKNKPQQPTVA